MTDRWSCQHFGLANGTKDPTNLPALLRKLADEIEGMNLDPMRILDLTISATITDVGPEWQATFYWSPDENEAIAPN